MPFIAMIAGDLAAGVDRNGIIPVVKLRERVSGPTPTENRQ